MVTVPFVTNILWGVIDVKLSEDQGDLSVMRNGGIVKGLLRVVTCVVFVHVAAGVSMIFLTETAAAGILSNGSWAITIVPGPVTGGAAPSFVVGTDSNWNSGFTTGGLPGPGSQAMTDNGEKVLGSDGVSRGSGFAGDGFAGVIGISVTGNNFIVPGAAMTGSVDDAGNMILTPTGRLASLSQPDTLFDKPFNIEDLAPVNATTWTSFSTGTVSAGSAGSISGSPLASAGDIDGDGIADFTGVLVSGGVLGTAFGPVPGITYFETWRVNILSGIKVSGFHVDTILSTASGDLAQTTAVPLPGAVWLFGSGLVGLLGLSRRRRYSC